VVHETIKCFIGSITKHYSLKKNLIECIKGFKERVLPMNFLYWHPSFHVEHPWNISISQKFLYSEYIVEHLKMFFTLKKQKSYFKNCSLKGS